MPRQYRSFAHRLTLACASAFLLVSISGCLSARPIERDPRLTEDCRSVKRNGPTYGDALEALDQASKNLEECTCRMRVLRGAKKGSDCR